MSEADGTLILRGDVVLPDRVLEGGLVVIDGATIQEVAEGDAYTPTHDYGQRLICPGLIDLHIHGIAGADAMDATEDSLGRIARRCLAHGVTGFLPTTVTASLDDTAHVVETIRRFMERQRRGEAGGTRVLGIHLEGPWIASAYKGAQNGDFIVAPDTDAAARLLDLAGGSVRIVTLAPELPGAAEVIALLRAHGVAVSIGHTGATYEQATRAVALGATHVTHAFNAMTPLHHRAPGVVTAALLDERLYVELIADGFHVHPAAMRLLARAKGRDRLMLITDAMVAAEMPDGDYALGGLPVSVRGGAARLASGTLAGSTLTLDRAVRNMVTYCGVSLPDAMAMAASTPAEAIGLGARKGRIEPGHDADLVVFERDLQGVHKAMIGGSWQSLPA